MVSFKITTFGKIESNTFFTQEALVQWFWFGFWMPECFSERRGRESNFLDLDTKKLQAHSEDEL